MPPMPRTRFTRKAKNLRIPAVAICLWLTLTALGSWRHYERWIARDANDAWIFVDGMLQVAVSPVWVVAKVATSHWGMSNKMPWVIAVNAAGFGVLIAGYLALCMIVRRLVFPNRIPSTDTIDPARRRFLRLAPEAALAMGTGGLAYATLIEPSTLHVRETSVPIADLPESLEGLRMLQITDTHRGPRVSASFIREAVDLGISQRPDLILLTGDYLHNGGDQIDEAADLLAPLVGCAPTLGVLGNHDWYASGSRMRIALANRGVRMLDNDHTFLTNERTLSDTRGVLAIGGVGDLLCDRVLPDRALGGLDERQPRLLLSHNPDVAERSDVRNYRVDLMLSGHTHGGQVRLPIIGAPGVPSRYGQKYAQGLVQGPGFPVFISAGVGMSVAPFRFGVPPEINVITLERA